MAKTLDKMVMVSLYLLKILIKARGDRNAAMQDILNTLDGGDTKI
jgi:hypothetical protein